MHKRFVCSCVCLTALAWTSILAAQTWKDKPIAQWSPAEAKQVLADSAWVKSTTPTLDKSAAAPRTMAGPGGVDIGGVGLGFPGMGRHGVNGRTARTPGNGNPTAIPKLTLRWASALPVSAAQVIAGETNAPAISEDSYAVCVYGLPTGSITGDPDRNAAELKRYAVLKRDGKKDIKPSAVEVQIREDGPLVIYSFPRSSEISKNDPQVEFDAQIGRLKIAQAFVPADMVYQGKLQL